MQGVYGEIMPGVNLRVIQTERFKTACFSATFMLPLGENAAKAALTPQVLRRGSKNYPDMTSLSAALDLFYGARIEPEIRKIGNIQMSGIICDLITPDCVPDGNELLNKTISLALEVLLNPCTESKSFVTEYVASERENLIDYLNAEINEKLSYSYRDAISKLYNDTGFGVNELGDVYSVSQISPKELYKFYKEVMCRSPLEIFFCGNAGFDDVKACVMPALKALAIKRDKKVSLMKPDVPKSQEICVNFDVNQANLLIGLYTPVCAESAKQPAMHVLAMILGGGTASKLFTHVREGKSLCYYTGAKYDKYLQTMFMYSGVAQDKVEEARGEMLCQLMECQKGNIADEELCQAKRAICDDFKTIGDSATGLEAYWAGESILGLSRRIEQRIALINAVSKSDVIDAAQELVNCMTYVLTGKEENYARKRISQNS